MTPTESTEWISVEERIPDVSAGTFRVRLATGDELNAFFYGDAMSWIAWYGQKVCHWWNANGKHERLNNVTHWMPLPKKPMSQ